MTILQKVPALLVGFACALALTACDGGDDGDSGGGSGGDDRSATILGLEGNATAGGGVFSNSCANDACHAADGVSGMAPSLATVVPNIDDTQIVSTFLNGKGSMPSQAGLSDQQLADVLAYVSDTFGG